jgi:lysophospholipase-3
MGGPYIQTFLARYVPQAWKDKYIASFISLAGPYAGAPIVARQLVAGTNFGIPILDDSAVKTFIRSLGGVLWMLPQNGDVFFMTPTKNYTGAQ